MRQCTGLYLNEEMEKYFYITVWNPIKTRPTFKVEFTILVELCSCTIYQWKASILKKLQAERLQIEKYFVPFHMVATTKISVLLHI